jgi:farnesyl-diphosphate farnesyltransferase
MVTVEPASSHIGIMKNETFFDLDTLFPKTLIDLDSPFRTGIFMLLFVFTLVLASSSSKRKKAAEIFFHPIEFVALVQYLTFYANAKIPKQCTPNELYCYQTLKKVSRSFSAVILELCEELRMAICIFYLVLRGLDTIEDDMSIDLNKKVAMLKEFASHLDQAGWNSREGYGKANPDEQQLLENFDKVIQVFNSLKPAYRNTIKDITQRMGDGMAEFAQRDVESVKDYDLYCHYVAGLVGIGLSQLFHASGLEDDRFKNVDKIANSMGLFLQKVNITRDYLEDILQVPPRIFYPKEIWKKYVPDVADMKKPEMKQQSLHCLNDMIANALVHIPDCLDYMVKIKEPSVFKFCAIPQVMAIATLERCYNNYNVFKTEVKIRKGEAVQLIMSTTDFPMTIRIFEHYINLLKKKLVPSDPSTGKIQQVLELASQKIQEMK